MTGCFLHHQADFYYQLSCMLKMLRNGTLKCQAQCVLVFLKHTDNFHILN